MESGRGKWVDAMTGEWGEPDGEEARMGTIQPYCAKEFFGKKLPASPLRCPRWPTRTG